MNFSNPILICDENEEFRILIRDMLTKNGFFHVLEASSTEEAMQILNEKHDFFVLIQSKALTAEISSILEAQKNFIVFADNQDERTTTLGARLGVHHIMSFPFHSRKLMDKINSLL